MSTILTSILSRGVWPGAIVLAACASTGDETSPIEPSAPTADAAVVEPAAAQTVATAEPETAPAPEAPPPEVAPAAIPNAEPAQLQPLAYGVCRYIGLSAVDDQTFVHYRIGAMGYSPKHWLHRLDEHGAIVETLMFASAFIQEPDQGWREDYTWIDKVLGRWPNQLLLLAHNEGREDDTRHLYRRVDASWKRVDTLGPDADIRDAWPWHSGSILAWGDTAAFDEPSKPRLAVMRGAPKGPSLAKLLRRSRCDKQDLSVRDVHVQADGKVTALLSCGGTWLGTWTPDDLQGTAERIGPDDWHVSMHMGAHGRGFIQFESTLLAWDGHRTQEVEVPKDRAPDRVFVGRDDEAWILQGRTLSRRTANGWERVAVPEGSPVADIAGLEHGTPWLLHKDHTVSMQTADGAWHRVPLPPVPDVGKVPKATQIHVLAPGDAWVEVKYRDTTVTGKYASKSRWAVYTTRDGPTPLRCGDEVETSPAR